MVGLLFCVTELKLLFIDLFSGFIEFSCDCVVLCNIIVYLEIIVCCGVALCNFSFGGK